MSRTTLNSEGSSIPVLSEEAQAALAEFYQEQQESAQVDGDGIKLISCGSNQNQNFLPIQPEDEKAVSEALKVYEMLPNGLKVASVAVPKIYAGLKASKSYGELHCFDIYNSDTDISIPFHSWPVVSPSEFDQSLKQKFDVLFSKLLLQSDENAKQLYVTVNFLLAENGQAVIQATNAELELLESVFTDETWSIENKSDAEAQWKVAVIRRK
ncbi:Oidioi.mRNA.OKI2018_I69.chr2.g7228.t1.cds [Oikopleura dioica]|uniref:Oidioi.mRNA.OKI2018_I69.chr2.g7228.t1.cds n=1 Tax=Oikopleura dioica TaxID=34765 RepID=A0ABN7T7U6_OIKDI|nr:Oidioi.mRNA.OKI2018_I69.chr2.g7228.t1.cds [Oikopleura dioica]